MEVLVGVALIGICVAILLGLVADHLRLTLKLTERKNKVIYAINKTEEACLGLLGNKFEKVEGKRIWRDMADQGFPWKVVEEVSKEDESTFLYEVSLADVHLQGVRIQKEITEKSRGLHPTGAPGGP